MSNYGIIAELQTSRYEHSTDGVSADTKNFRMLEWLLIPMIVGVMTLSHIQGWSRVVVLYGLVFSWSFLIVFLYLKLKLQPEIIIYLTWLAWAIYGSLNAIDLSLYKQQLVTIIQIGVLLFVVAGVTALRKQISSVLFAVAVGGVIVGISSYYMGEFQLASADEATVGAAGLARNANSFAYHLLFIIISCAYFWKSKLSWSRVLVAALIVLSVVGIIFSGSRKGFFGALVFILLWFLFCRGRSFLKKPLTTTVLLICVSGMIYFVTAYVISNTYMGKRIEYGADYGSPARVQMYKDGFEMIRDHPVVGVGLDNYRVLSTSGLYSHSDYIEVAANTGVVGFILYFSIYVVLWRRLNRIKERTNDSLHLFTVGVLKAAILTILLLAFGRPNLASKLTWVFLAGAVGYSWSLERDLLTNNIGHLNNKHNSS